MNISVERIFSISNPREFTEIALGVFRFQAESCKVYKHFISNLKLNPSRVSTLEDIPFLPIEFFKSHEIISASQKPEIIFTSSGTTGSSQSQHLVSDVKIYKESYCKGFREFYGEIKKYTVLGLLPSYSEREGSSLIYMVNDLIGISENKKSGYFLYNHEDLYQTLNELQESRSPTILIGVTYALLDFAERYSLNFPELIVMETGGMKGKRKELIREKLHEILRAAFGVPSVHSEYGMTELLSQAYSKGAGIFNCPKWMKVLIRDINDPLTILPPGKTGGINIIDLANLNSCSFIASQDLGKIRKEGSFEILGRFDNSDIRGCNLMVG